MVSEFSRIRRSRHFTAATDGASSNKSSTGIIARLPCGDGNNPAAKLILHSIIHRPAFLWSAVIRHRFVFCGITNIGPVFRSFRTPREIKWVSQDEGNDQFVSAFAEFAVIHRETVLAGQPTLWNGCISLPTRPEPLNSKQSDDKASHSKYKHADGRLSGRCLLWLPEEVPALPNHHCMMWSLAQFADRPPSPLSRSSAAWTRSVPEASQHSACRTCCA